MIFKKIRAFLVNLRVFILNTLLTYEIDENKDKIDILLVLVLTQEYWWIK